MPNIRETDLPGIGRKFVIDTRSGDKLCVVIHDDGRRELYHYHHDDPDDSISMITLDDTEARQIAGIIGGMTYQPKALETVEVEIEDLTIEWYRVDPKSKVIGKSIGELEIRKHTGANIIAVIEKDQKQHVNPGPDFRIKADSTLIVSGERHQVRALKQLISGGSE